MTSTSGIEKHVLSVLLSLALAVSSLVLALEVLLFREFCSITQVAYNFTHKFSFHQHPQIIDCVVHFSEICTIENE